MRERGIHITLIMTYTWCSSHNCLYARSLNRDRGPDKLGIDPTIEKSDRLFTNHRNKFKCINPNLIILVLPNTPQCHRIFLFLLGIEMLYIGKNNWSNTTNKINNGKEGGSNTSMLPTSNTFVAIKEKMQTIFVWNSTKRTRALTRSTSAVKL